MVAAVVAAIAHLIAIAIAAITKKAAAVVAENNSEIPKGLHVTNLSEC